LNAPGYKSIKQIQLNWKKKKGYDDSYCRNCYHKLLSM